jgi:ABC-type transporter Mla subunit MlaD
VAKKAEGSRIAVGAIHVVGELMKSADAQAQWMQEMLEQNARLVGQFPATLKAFNDSLDRFNQTVGRLDRAVNQMEAASKQLTGPLERVVRALDQKSVRDIPQVLEALRQEALPALRAASDTQRQVAVLQSTIERVLAVINDLPGVGIVRRMARPDPP